MEILKIIETEQGKAVSARELHSFLETADHFTQWCKRMFEYDFIDNVDYKAVKEFVAAKNGIGGTYKTDYALTLDCAKELAMLQRSDKGKEARKYFIECEKRLNGLNPKIPKTFSQALMLAAKQAEQIEVQQKLLEDNKPKVEFYEQVTGSKDAFDMVDVAKVCNLGVGRNKLFEFLRDISVLRENNTPYQTYIDSGYFRVIESKYNKPDGSVNISLKTVVYQKGIDFIIKKYNQSKQ